MKSKTTQGLIVAVAALGYFVDIYDLILFGIVRLPSLHDLGVAESEIQQVSILLLNMQMAGMLLGGLLFGIMGDTRGRVTVLFGSILMYSLANIANGLVQDIPSYAVIRFIAGLGLAGELGAGITLVSETMHREKRGYGTMIVVFFGAFGAVVAALVADNFDWRISYFVGGGLGLLLLLMRVRAMESGMFEKVKQSTVRKAPFLALLKDRKSFVKYIRCILIGVPVWFAVGILIVFSPEFGKVLGVKGEVESGLAVMWSYIGLSVGDVLTGTLSQLLKTRRKVIIYALLGGLFTTIVYLLSHGISNTSFYVLCFFIGLPMGYWGLFVTVASENFGTNVRATVTTTVPNFVRGSTVPITLLYAWVDL
jgi:MFS family permease